MFKQLGEVTNTITIDTVTISNSEITGITSGASILFDFQGTCHTLLI